VVAYLGLIPGTVLLYHFAGVANDALVYSLMLISFAALILSLVAARAADQKSACAVVVGRLKVGKAEAKRLTVGRSRWANF
jgi:hypothetical protein